MIHTIKQIGTPHFAERRRRRNDGGVDHLRRRGLFGAAGESERAVAGGAPRLHRLLRRWIRTDPLAHDLGSML